MQLRADPIVLTFGYPFFAHVGSFGKEEVRSQNGLGAGSWLLTPDFSFLFLGLLGFFFGATVLGHENPPLV
jgi:hypothetical protein